MSATIVEIYQEFEEAYNEAMLMMASGNRLINEQGTMYSDRMHIIIVEQSFMKIYLAWESFLENSFIAYLLGEKDFKLIESTKYAAPKDKIHAYNMIKGTKQYPDWTNIDNVKQLANLYFENSGNFSILSSPPAEFFEIKTIRNRISHISEQSTKSFNNLTTKNIAQTGITPGEYLINLKNQNTYFLFYSEMIKGYVDAICNVPIEN